MKAIMISIKPKWIAKILNGEKTIEVRKKFPKDYKGWVYIYCTKSNKYECLEYADHPDKEKEGMWVVTRGYPYANGKVVARFYCDNVEEIFQFPYKHTATLGLISLEKLSCLEEEDLDNYLKDKTGYAIHISQLEIFDKPKELSEFNHWVFYKKCEKCPYGKIDYDYGLCSQCCEIKPLTKAPQNFCYVEVEE